MIESFKAPDKKRGVKHTPESKSRQDESKRFWRENSQVPSAGRYNLTISEEYEFIWFRNAKVGSRTLFSALDSAKVKLAAESLYDCYYFPQEYRYYFKFAFVRNPWDRIVSGWIDKVARKNTLGLDALEYSKVQKFEGFVDYCDELDLETCNSHFRRQSNLIDTTEIDFIGRFERYAQDIKEIFGILNIPLDTIPSKNRSATRLHYSTYYTDETREKIARMYRKGIQLFGYEFEGAE